jgi:hypothetical protein
LSDRYFTQCEYVVGFQGQVSSPGEGLRPSAGPPGRELPAAAVDERIGRLQTVETMAGYKPTAPVLIFLQFEGLANHTEVLLYLELAFDAASRITSVTFDGCASIMTWLEETVIVVAPIFFA